MMADPMNQTSIATTASTPEADMNGSMEEPRCSPVEDDQQMAAIEHFHNSDVLCGRGVTTNRHPGNARFRALVGANKVIIIAFPSASVFLRVRRSRRSETSVVFFGGAPVMYSLVHQTVF